MPPRCCSLPTCEGGVAAKAFDAIVTAVQQAFAIEKVAFDTQNNSVILRDRVSKVIPARMMFEDLMAPRAQVVVELPRPVAGAAERVLRTLVHAGVPVAEAHRRRLGLAELFTRLTEETT